MTLTPTRRIITGHDANGRAIFLSDELLPAANPLAGDGSAPPPGVPGFTLIGKTRGVPDTSVTEDEVEEYHGKRMPLSDDGGVTCRVVHFTPLPQGATTEEVDFMHRTQSWDVGVVLSGKIWCVLDGGEEKEVGVGEVVVQRGTIHAWRNKTSEICKMLFVLVPSVPIKNKTTGEVLEPSDTRHLTTEEGAKAAIAKLMAARGAVQE